MYAASKSLTFVAAAACALAAQAADVVEKPRPMVLAYEYDITRAKTPSNETIRRVVDIISSLGYTQLQLYFKDNFAYPGHELVWKNRAHITPGEARELDAYCRGKGVELVPYQSSFGHLEPWFAHPEYRKYAECPADKTYYNAKFERTMRTSALCPTDPRSIEFMSSLFDVLLPCFTSRYVNLGCDEVWDLFAKDGRSAAVIAEKGAAEVYFGFILELHSAVAARGKTMMFWSDIVFNHPELVPRIPHDAVALEWGYEATSPFPERTAALKKAGCRFYVCPGTSSWCSFFGRHDNMKANVRCAWESGAANGAEGLLLTDWGDYGCPQPWLVSLPSLVYTASLVKEGRALGDAEIAARVDSICGCRVGESLIAAANAYLPVVTTNSSNGTMLFRRAIGHDMARKCKTLGEKDYREAVARLRTSQKLRDLSGAPFWVADDMALVDLLIDFVEMRVNGVEGSLAAEFGPRFTELWRRQNRPQGVDETIRTIFGAGAQNQP